MYPYLFGITWLPLYGILLAVGLLGAMLLFKFICYKKKVDDKTYSFYSLLAIVSIAMGLLGAFAFQAVYNAIYNAVNHLSGPGKETGGLTFMGGLITGVTVFVLGTLFLARGQIKRNFFVCASYAAPCIVLGHMFGRLGCFCAGCCYGKPTNSKLGVVFPDLKIAAWYPEYAATGGRAYPTQLFEAIFLAVLLAVMLFLLFKFDYHKILLPLYGTAYAVFRFFIEYVRGDYRGSVIPGITPSQFQVILLFLVATALAVLVYRFHIIPFAKAKDPAPKAEMQPPHSPAANSDTFADTTANDASSQKSVDANRTNDVSDSE